MTQDIIFQNIMKFIRELYKSSVLCEIKDSAGGSAKQGRDPTYQSILPLRGKIINAEKNSFEDVMKNEEVRSVINAIGIGFKDNVDIKKSNYGKVIILCDSDTDKCQKYRFVS